MEETKNREERIARIQQFWEQTKKKERREFLYYISQEGISERMMYRYIRYINSIPLFKIRALERCINEYKNGVKDTQNTIEERT